MPPILNESLWRTGAYRFRGYLYLDKPPIVFQCQAIGPTISYPVSDLAYHNVSIGAYTAVRQHATVWFGSTPGAYDYGRGRIRKVPNSTTIFFNRHSTGILDGESLIFPNVTYISVLDEFRPWARIPYIADGLTQVPIGGSTPALGTLFKDWDIGFTGNGESAWPIVNLGGGCAYAKYVDPNTNVITIAFNASAISLFIDNTPSTWLWDVRDGTIISGSSTSPIMTATFPPGRRIISLKATDAAGHATTRYLLVVACDDSTITPIKEFDVPTRSLEIDKPGEFIAIVREQIPRNTYPDQCYMIYWEEETYNNTTGPLNVSSDILNTQTGFEHIKFAGWHYTEDNQTTSSKEGIQSNVPFKGLDTLGWLNILPGFPFEMDRLSVPTSWLYQKVANLNKYFWFILYWHSTAIFVTDFYDIIRLGANAEDYAFQRLDSDGASLYEQIHKLSDKAIGYFFTANELGQLYISADPQLQATGDRTSETIVSAITEDDLLDIKLTGEHFPRSHWDRGAAIIASTSDVTGTLPQGAYVIAPGRTPAQGLANNDRNNQLVKNTGELPIRMGNRHLRENSIYSYLSATLIEGGDAGFDPAYGQWVPLTLDAAYAAQRGITFTNARCLLRKIDIQISCSKEGNSKRQILTLEVETSGNTAQDDPQPQNASPPTIQPTVVVPAPSLSGTPVHDGNMVFVASSGSLAARMAVTYNALGGSPHYVDLPRMGLQLFGASNSNWLGGLALDTNSNFFHGGTMLGAWCIDGANLCYNRNVLDQNSAWIVQYTDPVGWNVVSGTPYIIRPGVTPGVVYTCVQGATGFIRKFSNYGATLLWTVVPTGPGGGIPCCLDIDSFGSDEALTAQRDLIAGQADGFLVRTIGGGADVRLTGTINHQNTPQVIQKPLFLPGGGNNNSLGATEYIVYTETQGDNTAPGYGALMKTTNGGLTAVDISPNTGHMEGRNRYSEIVGPFSPGLQMGICDDTGAFYRSSNGGSSWTNPSSPNLSLIHWFPRQINGNYVLYGASDGGVGNPTFKVSLDNGTTWTDITGDYTNTGGGAIAIIPIP